MTTTTPRTLEAAAATLEALEALEARPWANVGPTYPRHGYELPGLEGCYVQPTDARHVYLGTVSGERTPLENRGQSYRVSFSAHLYLQADGRWDFGDPSADEQRVTPLWGVDELPRTALEKLRGLVLEVGRAWIEAHPEALVKADAAALNNAARSREQAIAKQAAELRGLVLELRAILEDAPGAPRY